jgi:hypothetical protein
VAPASAPKSSNKALTADNVTNIRRDESMRRILLLLVTIAFMVTYVSLAEAWQVNVKNSTDTKVTINVSGRNWFFFWDMQHYSVAVAAGDTGACVLPEGICSVEINGTYIVRPGEVLSAGLDYIYCAPYSSYFPCCWNVNVEVTKDHDSRKRIHLR